MNENMGVPAGRRVGKEHQSIRCRGSPRDRNFKETKFKASELKVLVQENCYSAFSCRLNHAHLLAQSRISCDHH